MTWMGSGKFLPPCFYVGIPIWTAWEMLLSNFWPQKAVHFFKGLRLGLLLTCLLKVQPILSSLGLFVLEPGFLFHCDFLPVSFLFQPKSYRETSTFPFVGRDVLRRVEKMDEISCILISNVVYGLKSALSKVRYHLKNLSAFKSSLTAHTTCQWILLSCTHLSSLCIGTYRWN